MQRHLAMLSNKNLTDALKRVRAFEGPVLSVYFDFNAARGRSLDELEVRAKSTLDGLDVSDEVQQLIMKAVDNPPPHAAVVGVFLEQNTLKMHVVPIPVALPVEDPQTGRGTVHIGRPYVEPLIAAIDATEPYAVLYADRDAWRLFAANSVEIEPVDHDTRSPTPGELDRRKNSKQEYPKYVADRGAATNDLMQDQLDNARDRFFRDALAKLEAHVAASDCAGIVLLGPEEGLAALEAQMAPALADKVVGRHGGLPDPSGSPAHVLKQIAPTLEAARHARDARLIDTIVSHGVAGLGPSLEAWQIGNLAEVALPWRSEALVFVEPKSGYVAATREAARRHQPDRTVERVPLSDVADRLATRFDVRLSIVDGELAERLDHELDGIGGRPRW